MPFKSRRPPSVVAKANVEYEKAIKESLEESPGKYRKAVKKAIKAYQEVLDNYDRTSRDSEISSSS